MREDITAALHKIVATPSDDNPFNQKDRIFAAALMEIRAALEKLLAPTIVHAAPPEKTKTKRAKA
jgi:hypothetical protein